MRHTQPFMSSQPPAIDVDYLARLARVDLTDAERATFGAQLEQILGHFQQLQELDVSGVEPTAHAFALENVLRADEPGPVLTVPQVLLNAPASRQGQIVVPKVVDDA